MFSRIAYALFIVLGVSCRTTSERDGLGPDPLAKVSTFNARDEITISVPSELQGLVPRTRSSQAKVKPPPGLQGLGLVRPVTSSGVESILVKCFRNDSEFIADNWFFYAELEADGEIQKSFSKEKVDKCNEMQIALKTLDRTKTYIVRASFYWESEDGRQTIVWYEGETKPFKPRDQNRALVLQKLRQDQTLNVDLEKTPKERCMLAEYLWNGQRCLDGFNAISFEHTDRTDYSSSGNPRQRKCLQIQASGQAVQSECRYSSDQMVRTKLHGTQELPDREFGWFVIEFDGKVPRCLTASRDTGGGDPLLRREACRFKTSGGTQIPVREQLFTLVETLAGDGGGRDTFRIANLADRTSRCISVPPIRGDISGVAPLHDGAPVRLTPCNTRDQNVQRSQFVNFVDGSF